MSEVTYITIPNIKWGSITIEKCDMCGNTVIIRRTQEGKIESIEHHDPIIIWDMGYDPTFWDKIKNLFKRIIRGRA